MEASGLQEGIKAKAHQAMQDLLSESEISDERRSMACSQAAIGALTGVNVWFLRDKELVCASFDAMVSLLKLDLNREACRKPATMSVIAAMKHHADDAEVLEKGLLVIRQACFKFEPNKATFDECGVIPTLVD